MDEIRLQREYYRDTAESYDSLHVGEGDSHFFALSLLVGVIEHFGLESVVDLGSGTGRAVQFLVERKPSLKVVGVEPVEELRNIGYRKGIRPEQLIAGDANALPFPDASFDVVCSFALLHHVRYPSRIVEEMLRVARRAVFISDSNNFGQGTYLARTMKQTLNALGLWPLANYVKTKGKGYSVLEGDGITYSYSVFNDFNRIQQACRSVHVMNTEPGGRNPYRTSPTVALLGLK